MNRIGSWIKSEGLRIGYKMAVMMISAMMGAVAYSNPQGGSVVAGQVTITQSPTTTTVQQSSGKAIIDWRSFNIQTGQTTQFHQPQGGIALNRISASQGPSQIFGVLTATGQIILVNPAGVWFGSSAHVDVAGLIVSTAEISNANFMAGSSYLFNRSSHHPGAGIINDGTIIARDHGLVALVGSNVDNNGVIRANLGHVVLASGDAFTIDLYGDQLLNFTISKPATSHANDAAPSVTNTGLIAANGGTVMITASAAQSVMNNVINMQGVIEANSVQQKNGEIILQGGDNGTVSVTGKLSASGKHSGEQGGQIDILGNQVILNDNAIVDVSGSMGGGTVLIGGDYHGNNPAILNANDTYVGNQVNILADAWTQGNGGRVIVWSNQETLFNGNIFANGGSENGNGGFIEVSSKNDLNFLGHANASAPHGNIGSILLDPLNIFIINGAANSGDLDSSAAGGTVSFNVPDSTLNTISVGELQSLGDINITLQAKNALTVGSSTGASATVDLSQTLLSQTLTLQAGDPSTVNGGNIIFNSGSSIITGGGNVDLIAGDASVQHTGNAAIGDISTNSGNISVTAQQAVALNGTLDSGGGLVNIQGTTGVVSINGNISSEGNDITVTGAGVTASANTVVNSGLGMLTINAGANSITTNSGSQLLSLGTIQLNANTMSLSTLGVAQIGGDGSGTVSDVASNVIVAEGSSGTSIGVAGAAGTLSLTSAELATVHADSVRIGDSQAGAITIASWTPSTNFATHGVLTLDSADAITQTGPLNLSVNNASLLLRDASSVVLTNAGNVINSIASNNVGTLSLTANNALTVASLIDDLSTVNGLTTTGAISLNASGLLKIIQNITTSNNNIILNGVGITENGGISINSGSGALTLKAGSNTLTTGTSSSLFSTGIVTLSANKMTLSTSGSQIGGNGSGTSTDFATNVILTEGSSGTSIGLTGASGTLSLSANILATIRADNVRVGDSNAGAIKMNAWTPVATFAHNGVLTLDSGAAITQAGALNLSASSASLLLRGASGVALTNSGNVITKVAANINGALSVTDGSGNTLTVGSVTDDLGTTSGIVTTGSNAITLANSGTANIILNNNVVSGSGVISFNAGQNVMIASGNVSTAGNVSLTSGTGSVNESGAGTISGLLLSTNSATGTTLSNANVVSQFNAINSGLGVISLTNDTPVMITGITQTGTGNVSVNNTGNINLTGTIAAGSSNNLFLTSSGSISETGSGVISNGNLVQTISVGGTLLNAVSNTFSQFNAANTGNGSVQLSDAAALTVTGISESGGGNIDLTDSNSSGITTSGGLFTVSSPATETINITANAMSFGAQVGGTSTGSGSTGTVILQPDTAGSSLGIAGASGTLQLTSTSLNNVYATNVRLGNSTAGNLSVGAFTPTATFASSNLTLDTAGSITQTGALNLGIDNAGLIVRDASSVALTNNGNVLSNIAATVSGAAQFTTSSALTVASLTDDLGTINGMSANNQNISLISGSTIHESGIAAIINTNLLTTSSVGGQTLTNNNAVSSFNATNISGSDVQFTDTAALTVTGISVSDGGNIALTDSNSGGITTTGGLFTVSSPATETINIMANNMSFGAQVGGTSTGNGSTGTVILQPDTLGNSLGIAGASGTLQLTAASLNNVYATNVRLGNSTAGNISVGAFTPTTTFASGNLTLDTAGSITQTGALNLGTDNAGFIVRDASSVALTNSASVLSNIAATVNGAAQWTTSGTLTVAALTDDLGTVNGISANNQNVSLTSGSTINESGAAVITNTNLLTTSSVGGQTLINSNAVSSLNAANNGGVISLTNNAPLNITAITETGTGNITVNNVGDINVTGSIAAGAANTVNLATSGAIAESGSGLISGAALVATSVNGETLGGANAMTSFTATNTNGNAISLINTATPLTIARISQTGTGNVSVNNTGAITLTGTISAGSTNNLVLTSSNTIGETGSGVISSGNLVQTASVGGTLFNAAANNFAQFNASNTGSGNIALTDAATTLNITGISQNGGGSVSLTEADVLSVANGASINSGNAALTITATNLNMNSTGVLNSGTGNITITQNTPSDTIGLGNTSGSMTITGSNLQNIFASNLTLSAPSNGEIIVDGITSANSANISNTVILSAVNGPTASIVFQNNPASFKALTVNSNDGITISHGAPLTTTVGNLVLNLDVNGAGGVLDLNDNVTAAGTLTLNATGGGIILTDPVITGNGGITFNGTVNGSVPVTINSGVNNTVFEQAVGNLAPIGDGTGFSITLNSTGTTSFAESVTANSGISAMGPVIFNDTVMLANSGSGSNFTSSVTLNNPSGMSINGYNGLNFNGGLIDTGGSITVNSNNSALNIAALTLSSAATLNTVGGNITLGTITGGQNLTLNAGAAGNITFNGNAELNNLDIINANIMTNHATINASTFIQQAGTLSNLGNLSNQVLNVVGNASITEGTVNGNINLGSLTLDVGNANLFGTVAGLFGQPAINTVTLLNTITAGTHFLDGIDMFNGNSVSNPSPPLTTTPISIQQTSPNLQQITSSQQINQGSTVTPNVGNVTVENVIAGGNALSSRLNGLVLPSTVAAALNPNSVLQGIASNTFTNPIANTLALPNTIPLVNALPSASTLSSGLSQALSSLETMALAAIDALDNMIKAGLYILSLVNPYTWTLLLLTTGTGVLFLRRKALSAALMSNKTYADMSFKLRTDVNNINGCAQIIYNESIGKVSATQKEFLHDILFGVNDVLQILTNVETNKMNVLSPKLVFRLRTALNDIKGFSQVIYEGMAGAVTNGQREFLLNISQGSDDILQLIPAQ